VETVIRKHLPFLLVVPVLIILSTWPTFFYVFELDTFWLPSNGTDIWLEIWEAWYGGLIFTGQADLFYTDRLFYPEGVSLAYHQFTLPHMLVNSLLGRILPVSNAFNLSFLLNHFANAAAAYVLLLYMFRDKWISLFGAALVGISLMVARASPFEQSTVATIPLAVYFLHRALCEVNWRFAILCGITAGFTAYIGSYVSVCILFTLGLYGCYLIWSRFKAPGTWRTVAIIALAMCIVGAPRLLPMLNNRDNIDDVIDFRSSRGPYSNDLQNYVSHPSLRSHQAQNSYLGALPLLLIAAGIWGKGTRRKMLPWLLILLFFITLSLGTFLTVGGVKYTQFLLPQHFLNELLPVVFRGFSKGHHWMIGALLPLAILSCFGLQALIRSVSYARFSQLVLLAIVLLALDLYHQPISSQTISESQLSFLEWLESEEEDGPAIRLVHLPMNETFVRWYYNFLQSLSGYPQFEGGVNRVLPETYNYIGANLLLRRWKQGKPVHCLPNNRADYQAALDQLVGDGLTHVVLHTVGFRRALSFSFESVPAAYEDEYVSIYRAQDLVESCDNFAIRSHNHLPHLQRLALSENIQPDPDITLLSAGPPHRLDDNQFTYYASVFGDWAGFAHLYLQDGAVQVQSAQQIPGENFDLASLGQLLLRLDARDASEPGTQQTLDEWLAPVYQPCPRVHDSADAVGEIWMSAEFPCSLVTSEQRLVVSYESGAELGNTLSTIENDALEVAFYWTSRPEGDDRLAYSIQVFDSAGSKVQQLDTAMPRRPLARHQLALSDLNRGAYVAKLIVYHSHTGLSDAGTVVGTQEHFERELEIARFAIE
jgi:hypothetical protein